MTYYILPKNSRTISVRPLFFPIQTTSDVVKDVISKSVKMRREALLQQIFTIVQQKCICLSLGSVKKMNLHDSPKAAVVKSCACSSNLLETVVGALNPVEYICNHAINQTSRISKMKSDNPILYNLFEMHNAFNMSDMFKQEPSIQLFHFSSLSDQEVAQVFKKPNVHVQTCRLTELEEGRKGHILFFDTFTPSDPLLYEPVSSFDEINKYFLELMNVLRAILTNMCPGGMCIVKMFTMSLQLELDFMFILNCLFEKTYVLKPESSHPLISDRYLICKTFSNNAPKSMLESMLESMNQAIGHIKEHFVELGVYSLLQTDPPYIFLIKLEEINAIIGQQQLDSHVHIVNTIKSKMHEDKHANIRKNNIYKAIQWCEKNGVPCNKTAEKYNAFSNPHFGFSKEKDKDKDNDTRLSF